jgi:uncharacterized SAM-binding protein YcdF (DUF218 family)
VTRLVAVLGYSDRTTRDLHPVCGARLARAAAEVRPDDVVMFSGWARGAAPDAEADLMAASWAVPTRARIVHRSARTTLGNAIAVARTARALDVDEVVLVTSSWHARRAAVLVRAALVGSGAVLRVAAADEPLSRATRVREAAAWLLVPLFALVAVRTR